MVLEKKFAEIVIKRGLIKPQARILIAASGGPDSSALCFLISKYKALFKIDKAELVYFNHGLRTIVEIKKDISAVKKLSQITGFRTRFIDIKIPSKGASLENKARQLRYQKLEEISQKEKFDTILTAHTSDDNAETLIMRLLRGAGIKGLSGILPVSVINRIRIVRPLIFFSKKEIIEYLKKSHPGFKPSIDSTNLDERFLRNAIRRKVIPLLERFNPRLKTHLNNLARMAREINDYIDEQTDKVYKKCVIPYSDAKRGSFLDLQRYFRYNIALKRRILSRWMGEPNNFELIESALAFLLESPAMKSNKFTMCGYTIIKKKNRAFLL